MFKCEHLVLSQVSIILILVYIALSSPFVGGIEPRPFLNFPGLHRQNQRAGTAVQGQQGSCGRAWAAAGRPLPGQEGSFGGVCVRTTGTNTINICKP